MPTLFSDALSLIDRGGPVMYPILGLSVIAMAIVFERFWRLLSWNSATAHKVAADMARHLRAGRIHEARALAGASDTPYGALVTDMLAEEKPSEALAAEVIEKQDVRIHRGFAFLSTVVTAAPMLGILGTVSGVIHAFHAISMAGKEGAEKAAGSGVDLQALSGGIGEALIATAAGIGVALLVLVPHNILRAKADRTTAHLETLAQAAVASPH